MKWAPEVTYEGPRGNTRGYIEREMGGRGATQTSMSFTEWEREWEDGVSIHKHPSSNGSRCYHTLSYTHRHTPPPHMTFQGHHTHTYTHTHSLCNSGTIKGNSRGSCSVFFSWRAMTARTCCPIACAWVGVHLSVGPSAFICVRREEGAEVTEGGREGCATACEVVGGEGVPPWEEEGLGEGSSTFT